MGGLPVANLRDETRVLNHLDLIRKRINSVPASYFSPELGVIEFHPSDVCNLKCKYCSYSVGQPRENHFFPFSNLSKVTELKPKAIVLCGGGEPTAYKWGRQRFEDLVGSIKQMSPSIPLGLITNGARVPSDTCLAKIKWVRISLDAATRGMFLKLKGVDGYPSRMENIRRYLNSPVETVGIGFLFNKENVKEIPRIIKNIFSVAEEDRNGRWQEKINLQFRATCPIQSCDCVSKGYSKAEQMTPDREVWWQDTLEDIRAEVGTSCRDSRMAAFVARNTNFATLFETRMQKAEKFSRCYISTCRWIIRANGDIYPCVSKATSATQRIGNILTDSPSSVFDNARRFIFLEPDYCTGSAECCRINSRTNHIVEKAITTRVPVSSSSKGDPFF